MDSELKGFAGAYRHRLPREESYRPAQFNCYREREYVRIDGNARRTLEENYSHT